MLVKVEVEHLELVMEDAPRLVWGCLSGRMYFLWCLGLMSVDVSSICSCGRFFEIAFLFG